MSEYSSQLEKGIEESRTSNYGAALQSFSKAIDIKSNGKVAYLNHGALCNQSGLYDVAIQDFSTVVQIDPWNIPAYFNRFLSHFSNTDHKSALNDLYISISLAYTKEGELLHKIQSFDKALVLVPNNSQAYLGRAKQYRLIGEYSIAESDITKSIETCQNYKEAYAQRAALYRKLKNNQKCQQDINRVLQITKSSDYCKIKLISVAFNGNETQLDNELKVRYKQFMLLRNVIYTKNQRAQKHLRVLRRFSEVHHETSPQFSQTNRDNNNISLSGISKLESQLAKFKKNVDEDRQSLNNSLNDSNGKKSRSDYSGNSAEKRKFVFTSGKTKGFQNILDHADFKDVKNQNNRKKLNMTDRQNSESSFNITKKQQTRSVDNEKHGDTEAKKRNNLNQIFSKMKTEVNDEENILQIQVIRASLTKNVELIGKMTPYCLIKYGRMSNKTQTDEGFEPVWNQKFKFPFMKSRGLFSLVVYGKETFKNDDLIGEAIISIQDGSTKASLQYKQQKVGTIQYSVKLL